MNAGQLALHSLGAAAWLALRREPGREMPLSDLIEATTALPLHRPSNVVQSMRRAVRSGWVQVVADRLEETYVFDESECGEPEIRISDEMALRIETAVDDAPGGISERLLAEDLQLTPAQLWWALREVVRAGVVEAVTMPAAHGGGAGWRPAIAARPRAGGSGRISECRRFAERADGSLVIDTPDGHRVRLAAGDARALRRFLSAPQAAEANPFSDQRAR